MASQGGGNSNTGQGFGATTNETPKKAGKIIKNSLAAAARNISEDKDEIIKGFGIQKNEVTFTTTVLNCGQLAVFVFLAKGSNVLDFVFGMGGIHSTIPRQQQVRRKKNRLHERSDRQQQTNANFGRLGRIKPRQMAELHQRPRYQHEHAQFRGVLQRQKQQIQALPIKSR